jgi:cytochrome c oxidase cbb3-type subunit 3
MSGGWSWYVILLTVSNIAGCGFLLWWTARRRPGDPKPEDTSHYWDDGDITEYNKPLPKWWINLFWITIVFGIAYLAWFPGMGAFAGYGKWSSQQEHAFDKAADTARLEETFAPYKGQSIDVLARDPNARRLGRAIFNNTCATCHGSSAQGAKGYPNLADDIWHWGGTPDRVLQTVLDGREGVMPEWGKVLTGMGGDHAVGDVAAYVRAMRDPAKLMQNNYAAAQGRPLYEAVCAGCHGNDGKGKSDIGAPDLTDAYWLYGGDTASLRASIAKGRHGSMPAHRELLGETRARLVAAYVWSLSHEGQPKGAAR